MPFKLKQHNITIDSAGTAKAISLTPILTHSVSITAHVTNTGDVHIGDDNVESSSETGTLLTPGENLEITATSYEGDTELIELSKIFVDADTSGNKVCVSYAERVFPVIDPFSNTKSLLFDGVDEYVDLGTDSSLDITTALSVVCWIKAPATAGVNRAFLSKWRGDTDQRVWTMGNEPSVGPDRFRVLLSADGLTLGSGANKRYYTSIDVSDNTWHHIAFTFESNVLKLYVDGVEDTSVVKTDDDVVNTIVSSTENTYMSSFLDNSGVRTGFYEGNLDEVGIWNKQLTDSEILEIYNSGSPANLGAHSVFGNLVSWWRNGDAASDSFPTIKDQVNGNNGTMTNMEAGDIEEDVP